MDSQSPGQDIIIKGKNKCQSIAKQEHGRRDNSTFSSSILNITVIEWYIAPKI